MNSVKNRNHALVSFLPIVLLHAERSAIRATAELLVGDIIGPATDPISLLAIHLVILGLVLLLIVVATTFFEKATSIFHVSIGGFDKIRPSFFCCRRRQEKAIGKVGLHIRVLEVFY